MPPLTFPSFRKSTTFHRKPQPTKDLITFSPGETQTIKKALYVYVSMYIYIYTLGAGGSPKVLWLGYCECLKIVISLWWNVSFWRSHSLHRMVFCADEFFWSARWLIKNPSFIHLYLWKTCDLCGKMTILEMLWWSKCSKVWWATVFLEVVS